MSEFTSSQLYRRRFLQAGAQGFALFLGYSRRMFAAENRPIGLFSNPARLGELQTADANGIRLLPGFRSRIIARTGEPVLTNSPYSWHKRPDGAACFATADGGWIYVSNSEVHPVDGGGGVGAIRFAADGSLADAYSILQGTDYNCAGGATPWRTWLSCEEVDRGQVYECDPYGQRSARPLPALGRFKHEAVAVDRDSGHLYLTEDEKDGGFYRFIPAGSLSDLSAGHLQVAEILTTDQGMQVQWHDVPNPAAISERTAHQVAATAHFNGGEGIAWHDGTVYFTTKGDNRVWAYHCSTQGLHVLYDAAVSPNPHLSGVDNVTITASGDVLVAEDGGDMQIVLLGQDGLVLPILQVMGHDGSEISGPAFSPDFSRLYFSSQRGASNTDTAGVTYEISRIA